MNAAENFVYHRYIAFRSKYFCPPTMSILKHSFTSKHQHISSSRKNAFDMCCVPPIRATSADCQAAFSCTVAHAHVHPWFHRSLPWHLPPPLTLPRLTQVRTRCICLCAFRLKFCSHGWQPFVSFPEPEHWSNSGLTPRVEDQWPPKVRFLVGSAVINSAWFFPSLAPFLSVNLCASFNIFTV